MIIVLVLLAVLGGATLVAGFYIVRIRRLVAELKHLLTGDDKPRFRDLSQQQYDRRLAGQKANKSKTPDEPKPQEPQLRMGEQDREE